MTLSTGIRKLSVDLSRLMDDEQDTLENATVKMRKKVADFVEDNRTRLILAWYAETDIPHRMPWWLLARRRILTIPMGVNGRAG